MSFDWRTEEDERTNQYDWDTPPAPEEKPTRRRPWHLIGLIGVLFLLAGALIWWRVSQRVEAATQAVRSDVIASHNLIQQAAHDGDEELFRSFLSGRNPSWTIAEVELFRSGLLTDRTPLGLTAAKDMLPVILPVSDEEPTSNVIAAAVELSPDLNEAIVTYPLRYIADNAESIVLQQTTVYRRGDQRWLLSPPSDEFWGEWLAIDGQYLSLSYPEKDEAVVGQLASDLDDLIGRMCTTLVEIECPPDFSLSIRLSDDPLLMAEWASPFGILRSPDEQQATISLPAPTLVGLPADGDGVAYDALLQAYARPVLTVAMTQAVDWQCCQGAALYRILLNYQLSRLGLADWPVGTAEYRRVLDEQIRLSDIVVTWRNLPEGVEFGERTWQLYTVIDFYLNAIPNISAADMMRTLNQTSDISRLGSELFATQGGLGDVAWVPASLDEAWWLYAMTGQLVSSTELMVDTSESLYLACTSTQGESTNPSTLMQYENDFRRWRETYHANGFIWLSGIQNPQLMLLQGYAWQGSRWQTGIWRDGQITDVIAGDNNIISFGETDPAGNRLIAYVFSDDGGSFAPAVVDLSACGSNCTWDELPGLPVWSPDGTKAIYKGSDSWLSDGVMLFNSNGRYVLNGSSDRFANQPLSLGPGNALDQSEFIRLSDAYSPFWLDDETYGFIRYGDLAEFDPDSDSDYEGRIEIATLTDPTPQTILMERDILALLPEGISTRWLNLAYVVTHPKQAGQLFIVAFEETSKRAYVFRYDLASGQIELRLNLLYTVNHSVGFSPDGRYLILTGQEDRATTAASETSGIMLLHNVADNHTTPILIRLPFFLPSVVYDWTEDGRLLAVAMDDNLVGLINPDAAAFQALPHSFGACTSVAWLQP